MNHCQNCGGRIQSLRSGGCGGRGATCGCPNCGAVYQQTSGGIVPTTGGESYRRIQYLTFKEELHDLAMELRVRFHDGLAWKADPDIDKWSFSEAAHGPPHSFATEQEAKDALAAYQQKLFDDLGYPKCDKCGKSGTKRGLSKAHFECKDCKRLVFVEREKSPRWFSLSDIE